MTSHRSFADDDSAPDIERFFCLYCSYDLTGHSGDIRRCPECGRTTSAEQLCMVLSVHREGIPAFESPVLPSLLFLPMAFFGLPSLFASGPDVILVIFRVVFVFFAAAWCWALWSYYRKHGRHYDWLWFLTESHLLSIQIGLGVLLLGVGVFSLIRFGLHPEPAILGGVGLVLSASAWWTYRDMKRRLPAYKLPIPPETNADE
jgi:hypothetical protein